MNDDELEREIRTALAAKYPPVEDATARPIAARRSLGRPLLIGSAAATVLLVAALAVLVSTVGSRHHSAAGPTGSPISSVDTSTSSPGAALVGNAWVLTEVSGDHGTVDLLHDHPNAVTAGANGAWIHLSPSGALVSSDTVNALNGSYTRTPDGLYVEGGFSTLVGALPLPWRDTVIAAIRAVSGGSNPVTVAGSPTRLVLSAGGYVLTFKNGGPMPNDPLLGLPAKPDAHGNYVTPNDAVRATCHAVNILGDYDPIQIPPTAGAQVHVGWQEAGQPSGVGWNALVTASGTGYRVTDCRQSAITHG